MSHFTVMVIGEDHKKQLAPFNENLELPRYVKYTKQQVIDEERKNIEDYKNGRYAEYLKDKEAYRASCKNNGHHSNYLENEFPKMLEYTDEQLYAKGIEDFEQSEIGPDGEVYSTSNPNSKWDWYEVGGRWPGMLKLKQGVTPIAPVNFSWGWMREPEEMQKVLSENCADIAFKKDIANLDEIVCFALLKDGKWYERGQMGWWAIASDEKPDDVWDAEFKKLVSELPDDTLITIVDCHI